MRTTLVSSLLIQVLVFCLAWPLRGQARGTAKVAVIQASQSPRQDPFMADYDPVKVRPQSEAHFKKLLGLFEKAGRMGADIVCGPENMQRTGPYGLYVDTTDPRTGAILFVSLATPVPGPLTDRVADIARRFKMYIIAPICERDHGKIYNTAVRTVTCSEDFPKTSAMRR